MAEPSGPRATFLQRLGAALIDGILLGIVAAILEAAINGTVGSLLALAVGIVYYGRLEGGASGQTLGKRALGIRVYDLASGGPIGTSRGILRYFARILSAIPCFLGYFWMLWDDEKQTWHDKIAGSVVVPVSAYPVANWPG
ncbi:MAG TPA: RDD family protein [Gaiellaceae bacterium]|nr:RDD family protein [Gaiellaceae bacterium]